MSAFADPEIIKMASKEFIPVSADDWYQRRRQDAEGKFFVKVANQGPRKGEGGNTRQGIYCLTADGELLNFKNAGNSAEATREQMKQALNRFKALPADRRSPGAVEVGDPGPLDRDYTRTPPSGGLIVLTHGRILEKKGIELEKGTCDFTGGDKASRDFLWLRADEIKAMRPAKQEVGFSYPMPRIVATRIARFHLIDNTRGEPDFWKADEIRKNDMTLTVLDANPNRVELSLTGNVLISDRADLSQSQRGYECTLVGRLTYDTKANTFTRFDVAALGDHWGASTFTKKGVRPGRTLLGMAFSLPAKERASDRVAPQAARELENYWGR
ncbi:MAG: hypothetical protein U0798_00620 [Gemmataceae bacterium]